MSNTYISKLRRKRIEQGMCGRCGKFPLSEGTKLCEKCREYYSRRWANRSPELIKKHAIAVKNWTKNNPDKAKAKDIRYRHKLRVEVITHYGKKCACCGEGTLEFLTLDHIDGNGNAHRREIFGSNIGGWAFYRYLRKSGYPKGLQVLCWNCNMAKAHYGICPHNKRI